MKPHIFNHEAETQNRGAWLERASRYWLLALMVVVWMLARWRAAVDVVGLPAMLFSWFVLLATWACGVFIVINGIVEAFEVE